MEKRILVTGGDGFIGSNLINKLVATGYEVASFDADINFTDNPVYYKRALTLRKRIYKNKPSRKYKGDIRNKERFAKIVKDFKPEIIVHLAGLPMARVGEKYANEIIPINMHGTFNVLEVFEKSDASKIIYTSSSMAYGHFKQTPQSEEFILDPINLYGATKAAGEYFVKLSKKDWVIVRPTSVYGFTDCANRVTQLLIDAAILKKSAWVVKGETLDFSYIEDVTDGFMRCIHNKNANNTTLNISRGEARGATEFAEILKKYFPDFSYDVREATQQQVWRGPLDITLAKKLLKFEPKYSIEDGIKETLSFIEEYNFYDFK